ncbi:MAG: OmpH family outer membrane protein [Bacteroidetes bacterium]|nr:MAG: OmpH family outer membrane protein [Bacteroidota bacterium]
MKKVFALFIALCFAGSFAFAQRMGYVDTEYIMGKIPEYEAAQEEIDRVSQKWQEELEAMYQDIERMYNEYQQGEVLMPEDLRREKQEEIFQAERDAKEYREKKFGYNGELFALQESKIKPIQEKVFKAVETVAKRKKYDFVYDKAGEVTWLYTNAAYDLSDLVLEELGYDTREN